MSVAHMFVSRRDFMLRTTLGHCISFEKNKPTHVPKALHALALEKGILPCDDAGQELELASAQDVAAPEAPKLEVPEDAEARQDAIKNVCREIAKRNKSSDFNAGGTPRADSVTLALGYRVDQKEVRQAWVVLRPELLGKKDE